MSGQNAKDHHTDCLLIFPKLGCFDDLIMDPPLSIIYAATHSVKKGFNIRLLDLRLIPHTWQEAIDSILVKGCSLVGFSVMTGNPINTSLEVSQYIKSKYGVPIVWGGPHPTLLPKQTLENPAIDYIVRGWGSKALCLLLENIRTGSPSKTNIPGLGYKEDGKIRLATPQTEFEKLDFRDLPYNLIDISGKIYTRFKEGTLTFPILTSMGCPYNCSFCISPVAYKDIKGKKWITYDIEEVLDHIAYLGERYDPKIIQIYDDESFVDLNRMRELLRRYISRGYHEKYKLMFRGIRINDLFRMDNEYFSLLEKVGVDVLLVGFESGSQRVLDLMKKGVSIEQIIEANKKIAKHPALTPNYNFFVGIPGENIQSLIETKDVLLKLLRDNPNCYLGAGSLWKPIPGSVAAEIAVKEYGLKLPSTLEEWAVIDSFDAEPLWYPWFSKEMEGMFDLLQMIGLLMDKKTEDLTKHLRWPFRLLARCLVYAYRPLLRLRQKKNFTRFFIEKHVRDFVLKHISWFLHNPGSNMM
jgi:anaerobic magnesium-protoporphyrin IX monomethyl ester cyclase